MQTSLPDPTDQDRAADAWLDQQDAWYERYQQTCQSSTPRPQTRRGWLWVSLILGGIYGLSVLTGTAPPPPRSPAFKTATPQATAAYPSAAVPIIHRMGTTVRIGYTSYVVWRAWWADHLTKNQLLNRPPDATYLFVELTVQNDDRKARSIPPFTLVDERGAEYQTSSAAWAVDGSIDILDSLNPGVFKQGKIVFDVPRTHRYQLKVSGGYWSGETAYIELVPK